MKPPPLLLGTTLLFWGWQSGFLIVGAVMGVILESPRIIKARWEFTNEDFQRIWTFCTLALLASLVYAFTANEGPSDVRGFFQNPSYSTQRDAGLATARTAASMIRWLPMLFFLFVTAQVYSSREAIPLETISLILRRRWRKARQLGQPLPPTQHVNVSYPYFGLCLFASCIGTAEHTRYFWALSLLLPWALWPFRPRRYGLPIWAGVMCAALLLGYLGQRGIGELARYVDGFNSQLLARWTRGRFDASQSRTELGRIGRLKSSMRIVLRVQTPPGNPPPPLLREASYRSFKGPTWFAETPRGDFEAVQPETNQTTWVLLPGKTNTLAVNIACSLSSRVRGFNTGLLPLPSGSGQLQNLPAYLLSKNSLGAVLAQGPGLIIYDAHYSAGSSIDSAPTPDDLEVPSREKPALQQVIDGLRVDDEKPAEALQAIRDFFTEHFQYSMWQERDTRPRTNDTPLARFLLSTRSGHCEYFATASVLLLRELGIPARYAVGHVVHESAGTRKFVVRDRDAHAWCLVWNEARKTWDDFDTTPGSWMQAEAQPSTFQWLSDFWSRVKFELSKLRWGQTRLRQYLLWTVVPVLLLLLYKIIFRRRGRKRRSAAAAELARAWPGLDSEFYELAARVERRGVARQPGESLSGWLARAMADPGLELFREPLQQLVRLHYQYRFDPLGLSREQRQQLRAETAACLARLNRLD